jgi:hypothetical protein
MSWLPRPVGPREALRDLGAFMRQRSREQVLGGALAILVTAIIVIEFLVDPYTGAQTPPQVVEVQLYSPNRTDADIIADQKKDQAERRAYQAEKRRQFQRLEKQLGMD